MKVTRITYGRTFSLGNYENEKISIEAEVTESEDVLKAYVELKKSVEHAHEMRNDLRKFEQAKDVLSNADAHNGYQVRSAQSVVKGFATKYPTLVDDDKLLLGSSELPKGSYDDSEEEDDYEQNQH